MYAETMPVHLLIQLSNKKKTQQKWQLTSFKYILNFTVL